MPRFQSADKRAETAWFQASFDVRAQMGRRVFEGRAVGKTGAEQVRSWWVAEMGKETPAPTKASIQRKIAADALYTYEIKQRLEVIAKEMEMLPEYVEEIKASFSLAHGHHHMSREEMQACMSSELQARLELLERRVDDVAQHVQSQDGAIQQLGLRVIANGKRQDELAAQMEGFLKRFQQVERLGACMQLFATPIETEAILGAVHAYDEEVAAQAPAAPVEEAQPPHSSKQTTACSSQTPIANRTRRAKERIARQQTVAAAAVDSESDSEDDDDDFSSDDDDDLAAETAAKLRL